MYTYFKIKLIKLNEISMYIYIVYTHTNFMAVGLAEWLRRLMQKAFQRDQGFESR